MFFQAPAPYHSASPLVHWRILASKDFCVDGLVTGQPYTEWYISSDIHIYYIYTQLYTITNIFTSSVYMHHTLSYNICIYTEQHLEQTCDVIHIISYINVNVHQIYSCIISYIYIYLHISSYIYIYLQYIIVHLNRNNMFHRQGCQSPAPAPASALQFKQSAGQHLAPCHAMELS